MRQMKYALSLMCCGFCVSSLMASTIAYWPMNVSGTGDSRKVPDTLEKYDLQVRSSAYGAPSFIANDIGWTLPPNPDNVGAASTQALVSTVGSTGGGSQYRSVLSSADTTLCETLSAFYDFTIEGWCRLDEMPDDNNGFCFVINNTGLSGGWVWKLLKPDANGYCVCRLQYNCDGNSKPNFDTTVHKDELLDRWNHYAIVCVANAAASECEWRFYLNGRLRGSKRLDAATNKGSWSKATFGVSGVQSSSAQQIVGDLLCWRASDTALDEGDFLCDVQPAGTVAYWPMSPITIGSASLVPSATGSEFDLTLRNKSLGGVGALANDIGWTEPANPDPQSDKSAVWTSDKALNVSEGEKSGTTYQPVFSSSSKMLDASLAPTNDFCVEGWYCATGLPAGSTANHMFVYSTHNWYGGWVWNIYGADGNGKCAVKVVLETGKKDGSTGSSRKTYDFGSLASSDVLNKWNHYALVFDSPKNLWKFYFNGVLVGAKAGDPIADMPSRTPLIYMFGVTSGTAQIPQGKLTTWRVSRGKFTPSRFLCGDKTAANFYTWTGNADAVWSTGSAVNWKDAAGTGCAWKNYMGAFFDGTGAASVSLSGEVNPSAISVTGNADVTITAASGSSFIGTACEEIVKDGTGTLAFVGTSKALNKSSNRVCVKAGTLRVSNVNGMMSLGDATSEAGYEVVVSAGSTLIVDRRNALGENSISKANRSRFTVYTNGVFNLTHDAQDEFNYQAIGILELLGGSVVLPGTGHPNLGCLFIRNRATFGCNDSKAAYVFNEAAEGNVDSAAWSYGTNTIFDVADVTADEKPDVVFGCHFLAVKDWQDATSSCCFRKMGSGTMVLRQASDRCPTGLCYPTGGKAVNVVEAGELRVDCDYTGPSFDVASGAFLSGTGVVSGVTFATGAGMKGVLGDPSCLRISGACTIEGAGVVALRAKNPSRHRVKLATVAGDVVGAANLKNWAVSIDGVEQKDYYVTLIGRDLVAKTDSGFGLIIR